MPDGTFLPVPCGRCHECLHDYQQDWTLRLKAESKHLTCIPYVTLTYNNAHLPTLTDIDGTKKSVVIKRHVQLFLKRLRKAVPDLAFNFKYFAVGEYGGNYNRSHYHLLLFSSHWKTIAQARKEVRNAWKDRHGRDIGFIKVKQASDKSIHYLTKYLNKLDARPHFVKPFRLMSKGIGRKFFSERVVNFFLTTFQNYIKLDGRAYRLPRYYRDLLSRCMMDHPLLSRTGLTWQDCQPKWHAESSHPRWYFEYFCNNFADIYSECYRKYVETSRKNGYQVHEYSRQECFADFLNSNAVTYNAIMENRRILDKCKIKNHVTATSPYIVSGEMAHGPD